MTSYEKWFIKLHVLESIIKKATLVKEHKEITYKLTNEASQLVSMEDQFIVIINLLLQNHKEFLQTFMADGFSINTRSSYLRIMYGKDKEDMVVVAYKRTVADTSVTLRTEVLEGKDEHLCIELCWDKGYFYWISKVDFVSLLNTGQLHPSKLGMFK